MRRNTLIFIIIVVFLIGGFILAFKQSIYYPSDKNHVVEKASDEVIDLASKKEVNLEIKDYEFAPVMIRVRVGTVVTWTNRDASRHNAAADDKSFKTKLLGKDESASVIFDKAGTFGYFCSPHPFMRGTIIVEENK